MLKKFMNLFKKDVEKVVEESIKKLDVEKIVEENEETSNEEVVEPSREEWTQDVYIIEEVNEEEAKDFDVDTEQRFEIYMGETEETVTLVNEGVDFASVEEAKAYANFLAVKNYPKQEVVIFIHEETTDENGVPVTNRHY
jgi:hypothetical protein